MSAPRPTAEIHEAIGRLHSAAWHGRGVTPGDKPRFSIPRQPTDDDEVAYAAVEELARLRGERAAIVAWLRAEAAIARGMGPVDRAEAVELVATAIEQERWRTAESNGTVTREPT